MDSVKSQLEMLSEDSHGVVNYVSWRFKLDIALKTKDLYYVATGHTVKPEGGVADEAVKNWLKKDLEAQSLIGLNVSSSTATKIASCVTAKQMLDKLISLYGTKTEVTLEVLRRKLFMYAYNEGKSATENCLEIVMIGEQLSAANDPVRETWLMTKILSMLPQRLAHFRTSWDNVTGADKNVTNLIERLRLEDERQTDRTNSNEGSSNALIIKQNKKQGKSTTNNPEKGQGQGQLTCHKCGQKGHFRKDCRNKPSAKYLEYCRKTYPCNICNNKGHFAKECPNQNDQNKLDNSSQQRNRRAFLTVGLTTAELNNILSQNERKEVWYQDCGSSQHMTPNRNWFKEFEKLDNPRHILIGDSTRLEGVAVGTIELEAFDGHEWYPVTLTEVLYVLN